MLPRGRRGTPALPHRFSEAPDKALLEAVDAALIPDHVVLFGNLPTRTFYSDAKMPLEKVERLTCELIARMRETGHPFIFGSECDVLSVPEAGETIRRKVDVMLTCSCR